MNKQEVNERVLYFNNIHNLDTIPIHTVVNTCIEIEKKHGMVLLHDNYSVKKGEIIKNVINTIPESKNKNRIILNLIVSSSHLLYQWQNIFNDSLVLTLKNIDKNILNYKILIISIKYYNRLSVWCRKNKYICERIIYDECEILKFGKSPEIVSKSKWYLTTNPKLVLFPNGLTLNDDKMMPSFIKKTFTNVNMLCILASSFTKNKKIDCICINYVSHIRNYEYCIDRTIKYDCDMMCTICFQNIYNHVQCNHCKNIICMSCQVQITNDKCPFCRKNSDYKYYPLYASVSDLMNSILSNYPDKQILIVNKLNSKYNSNNILNTKFKNEISYIFKQIKLNNRIIICRATNILRGDFKLKQFKIILFIDIDNRLIDSLINIMDNKTKIYNIKIS